MSSSAEPDTPSNSGDGEGTVGLGSGDELCLEATRLGPRVGSFLEVVRLGLGSGLELYLEFTLLGFVVESYFEITRLDG